MTDADDKPADQEEDTAGPLPDVPHPDDEEEHIPPDLVVELFRFMEDVLRIEAHVWAAEKALHEARLVSLHPYRSAEEAQLLYERANFLMATVAPWAEDAAERAHRVWPDAAAYSEREHIRVSEEIRKAEEREEAEEARRHEE
jgi:hypothetical protein